jgi:ribosomal protein S13/mRNA-degrading endonuclease HigB of HigAB toxin-antitoxin module
MKQGEVLELEQRVEDVLDEYPTLAQVFGRSILIALKQKLSELEWKDINEEKLKEILEEEKQHLFAPPEDKDTAIVNRFGEIRENENFIDTESNALKRISELDWKLKKTLRRLGAESRDVVDLANGYLYTKMKEEVNQLLNAVEDFAKALMEKNEEGIEILDTEKYQKVFEKVFRDKLKDLEILPLFYDEEEIENRILGKFLNVKKYDREFLEDELNYLKENIGLDMYEVVEFSYPEEAMNFLLEKNKNGNFRIEDALKKMEGLNNVFFGEIAYDLEREQALKEFEEFEKKAIREIMNAKLERENELKLTQKEELKQSQSFKMRR